MLQNYTVYYKYAIGNSHQLTLYYKYAIGNSDNQLTLYQKYVIGNWDCIICMG